MALAPTPFHKTIDLSKCDGPSEAKVIIIPFPKNTAGIVFGQRTAEWDQFFNTYILDTNNIVVNPQAFWNTPKDNSQFAISAIVPPGAAPPDANVLNIPAADVDRYIAVHCSHKKPNDTQLQQSEPRHSFHTFKIGDKNAISVTMVNAEDGGDSDFHDTVVGVAVAYLTK